MPSFPDLTPALAVVSGKGGVGKSVVAVNLAERLAAAGRSVALLDADLGQSACAVLMNETPPASVRDWAAGRAAFEDAMRRTEAGVTLAVGAALPELADPDTALFEALDATLAHLRATHDVVLIDAPAGLGPAVRWALERADRGLLVLVGEPTAVADAYRLCRLVWTTDPAFPLDAVVNAADTEAEAESVWERFGLVTERFLAQRPPLLGWVPYAAPMRRAVREQVPAAREPGAMQSAFDALADTLLTPA